MECNFIPGYIRKKCLLLEMAYEIFDYLLHWQTILDKNITKTSTCKNNCKKQ